MTDAADAPLLLLMLARVPPEGRADFQAYEEQAIPFLASYGGRLERRMRTADAGVEAHVVSFPDRAAFDSFRADKRRAALAPLLERSGARIELLEVGDV